MKSPRPERKYIEFTYCCSREFIRYYAEMWASIHRSQGRFISFKESKGRRYRRMPLSSCPDCHALFNLNKFVATIELPGA